MACLPDRLATVAPMRRLATCLLACVALTAASAGPAEAKTCANTFGGDVISAENVNCKRARAVVRTWAHRYKRDGKVNRKSLGFKCRDKSNSVEGLVVRCSLNRRVVRFYANVPQ